eukprot:6175341-Pleurochrysis_carterae.AAC.2
MTESARSQTHPPARPCPDRESNARARTQAAEAAAAEATEGAADDAVDLGAMRLQGFYSACYGLLNAVCFSETTSFLHSGFSICYYGRARTKSVYTCLLFLCLQARAVKEKLGGSKDDGRAMAPLKEMATVVQRWVGAELDNVSKRLAEGGDADSAQKQASGRARARESLARKVETGARTQKWQEKLWEEGEGVSVPGQRASTIAICPGRATVCPFKIAAWTRSNRLCTGQRLHTLENRKFTVLSVGGLSNGARRNRRVFCRAGHGEARGRAEKGAAGGEGHSGPRRFEQSAPRLLTGVQDVWNLDVLTEEALSNS